MLPTFDADDCATSRGQIKCVASSPRHFPRVNPPLPDSSKSVYMSQILRLVLQNEYGQGLLRSYDLLYDSAVLSNLFRLNTR
jgi:hypothetical protein